MQSNAHAGSRINVARYDDDYPLLYGEPAVQPRWDTAPAKVVHLATADDPGRMPTAACGPACRSCGRCRGQ